MLRKVMKQLSFELVKRPDEVRKFANRLVMISILGIIIPDLLAFALKGAELTLNEGKIAITVILLLLYFSDRTLMTTYTTFMELIGDTYTRVQTAASTEVILDLTGTVKGKVHKKTSNGLVVVETPELIQKSKDYLSDCWRLILRIPTFIVQILSLVFSIVLSTVLQSKTASKEETIITTIILVIAVALYFIFSQRKIKVWKKFRRIRKENESKVEVLYTDLKTLGFMSRKDLDYHAEKLRSVLEDRINVEKDEHFKINKVFIKRSVVATMIMMSIIFVKLILGGNLNMMAFIDIVALSSIYSSILGRISSITGHYEDLMNIIVDIDTLYPDFKEYYDVYQEEQRKKVVSEGIDSVVVKAFKASLDPRWRFVLENTEMITLKRGDVHLVHGQTGCGKSTLLTTLTGGLFPENSPIQFSNGDSGYLNSLTYQTDRAMANNFVINEISLNDGDDIDIFKILEILKGLCLYDEILMMIKGTEFEKENVSDEEKVISFIRAKRVREFSSGQMQRLALAKLLYQLDDSIQMVALDEPFNRLDDETTVKCAEFVIGYIMRNPRIVILATHQVSQCKPFCNKEICFRTELNKSFLVAK